MERARVLVRRVAGLDAAVDEALDFLGYGFAGKKVWVKPNLLSPHPPEHSVTTQPELISAVVRALRARAAAQIWVADNPGGALRGNAASFLAATGAIEASLGCFTDAARDPVELRLSSRFVGSVRVSRFVKEADVILNLPVLKTHALTLLTGAIKNLFGTIPGAQKARLHLLAPRAVDFAELLVDIYAAMPMPVLTVMDALLGMDGLNGPGSGRVLSIGKLITGTNPVAVDTVMALMAGVEPGFIPMLRHAGARGLGPIRREQLDISGDFSPVPGFKVPSARLARSAGSAASVLYRFIRRRPVLTRKRCIRCRRCLESCPVSAITMAPYPRIDRHTCITCYCCAEVCPERALAVPGVARGVVQYLTGR